MRIPHGQGACWRRRPFGIVPVRPLIPGGRCSQGGVKVPTGGKGEKPKPASAFFLWKFFDLGRRVSRFGVIPKPTVKVRMKENGRDSRNSARRVVPYALILVLKEESHESDVARYPPKPKNPPVKL